MSIQAILFCGLAAAVVIFACVRFFGRSAGGGRPAGLQVRVAEICDEAEGIKSFRLEPQSGNVLPETTPGSHISVWPEGGLVRHYSVCNAAGAPDHYRIAVKLEECSRGGSEAMHALEVGDLLKIGSPRNNFELIEGACHYLLFAGGIGITPVLPMVRELERRGADYRLHYFTRSLRHTAFHAELSAAHFAGKVSFHHDVQPEELKSLLPELIRSAEEDVHLYMCGPRPFMDAVEKAARLALSSDAIHREYFAADPAAAEGPREAFEVELARSGKTLLVPADASILDVLTCNGIRIEHSCQEGLCGTCLTRVLEGEPDHRDSFLTESERKAADKMLVCVSRCKTRKLVLEL
jgi:vanillate O-demethylase ferredoxin subunit